MKKLTKLLKIKIMNTKNESFNESHTPVYS